MSTSEETHVPARHGDDVTARTQAADHRDPLLELSLDLICEASGDGYFTRVNPAFTSVLGWCADELLARPFLEFVAPEDRARTQELVRTHVKGHPIEDFQNRYLCKDGSVRWLSWRAVLRDDGTLYATARDVTQSRIAQLEIERARQEAEAASRAKSAFLATMSHEIRTPMNGVIGMIEVLTRTTLSADQREMVATARESAAALLTIIDDILDFSKIEADKMRIECVPLSIEHTVETLCASLVLLAERNNVALYLDIDPGLPAQVLGDDLRLRQVLYNLIGNAIKFSGGALPGGRIYLRIAPAGGDVVRFEIEDNGIGMPPDAMATLFQPFVQAETTTTRRFGGTGLGLAICRRLTELMGGSIAAASQPGAGATFTVCLPLRAAGDPLPRPSLIGGVHCAIIGIAEPQRDTVARYLRHAGAVVTMHDDLPARIAPMADRTEAVVLLHGDDANPAAISALIAQMPTGAGRVRLRAGYSPGPASEAGHAVSIGRHALRRRTLEDAVALAAKRLPPAASPLVEFAEFAEPEIAQAGTSASAHGYRLLVAEDDEINRRVMSRQLQLLGYRADFAADGADALDRWRRGSYALLLTDLHMPRLDGYALCDQIRAEEAQAGRARMPVIALTANAIKGEALQARDVGMDDYLTKPLTLSALQQTLAHWLPPPSPALAEPMPTAGSHALPVFDAEALRAFVGDDAASIRELLNEYERAAQTLAAGIRRDIAAQRPDGVAHGAHRLKSSSRAVGAFALGEVCHRMEAAARHGNLTALGPLGEEFDASFARLGMAIRARLELRG
ncbi:PAS domain-containing hybrid sensor histidine kinase/response regulator [Cupriavidus numazuensis]|uniref:histidine kinase n=1 Tax=Cupriavidus numazuensis TaxID=221992 RepID=A0ABM8TC00_9BURK|nr:ATP-binding protein [Cupriavidus numazuensis]CAG2134680.1 Sensor histidine kinase RcsC [Cupriavidus numazuensis]